MNDKLNSIALETKYKTFISSRWRNGLKTYIKTYSSEPNLKYKKTFQTGINIDGWLNEMEISTGTKYVTKKLTKYISVGKIHLTKHLTIHLTILSRMMSDTTINSHYIIYL